MKQEIRERIEKIHKGEVPEGFQKQGTRIIPIDWAQNVLGGLITYTKGFAFKSSDYISHGIRIIRVSDTTYDSVKEENAIYIDEDRFENHKDYELLTDDLVVSTVGSKPPMYDSMVGKIIKIHDKISGSLLNQNAVRLRVKDQGKFNLIYYQLKTKRYVDYIKKIFRGNANQASITLEDLFNFIIIFPQNNKESDKIAEILSTWGKAIELKEKLIEEKKEFKKGLMQKLLTGDIRVLEFIGEWKKVVIGDIFEEVKRINDNISMDIEILTISAKHGFLSQRDKFSRVIAGSSLKKYTHLHQNEFAYNKGNSKTAPFGCIFKLDMKEGLVPFVYICFRPTQMIDVDFFDFYFKHGLLDCQLKRIITSGARSDGLLNVSKADFFNIKIPLPSLEEQKKIGFILRLIQNEIDYLIAELNQLKEQKRGLMQLVLTGIVRVEVN